MTSPPPMPLRWSYQHRDPFCPAHFHQTVYIWLPEVCPACNSGRSGPRLRMNCVLGSGAISRWTNGGCTSAKTSRMSARVRRYLPVPESEERQSEKELLTLDGT